MVTVTRVASPALRRMVGPGQVPPYVHAVVRRPLGSICTFDLRMSSRTWPPVSVFGTTSGIVNVGSEPEEPPPSPVTVSVPRMLGCGRQ